jgi:hypothetical protein
MSSAIRGDARPLAASAMLLERNAGSGIASNRDERNRCRRMSSAIRGDARPLAASAMLLERNA